MFRTYQKKMKNSLKCNASKRGVSTCLPWPLERLCHCDCGCTQPRSLSLPNAKQQHGSNAPSKSRVQSMAAWLREGSDSLYEKEMTIYRCLSAYDANGQLDMANETRIPKT